MNDSSTNDLSTNNVSMNDLHIIHVLASFEVGGAERVALSLVRSQLKAGAKVTVVALSEENPILREQFDSTGVKTKIILRSMRGVDFLLARKLKRFFLSEAASVIHAHNPLANIYATMAARQAKLPIVYTKHGDAIAQGFRMWLRKKCASKNNAIVAVSEATADTAMQIGENNGQRPFVIENGVDCEVFQPNPDVRSRVRRELGFTDDHFVFGSVARLQPVKRHDIQLDAVEPLLDDRVRMVVVGDGPLGPELNQRVAESEKSGFISMLGNRTDVDELLTAFDVFVLSSEREGLPLVILESMASGTPVIATAVGGIPKVVEHNSNGFLVPEVNPESFRSGLSEVLQLSPQRLASVAQSARNHIVEGYSTRAMAAAYERVYRDIL